MINFLFFSKVLLKEWCNWFKLRICIKVAGIFLLRAWSFEQSMGNDWLEHWGSLLEVDGHRRRITWRRLFCELLSLLLSRFGLSLIAFYLRRFGLYGNTLLSKVTSTLLLSQLVLQLDTISRLAPICFLLPSQLWVNPIFRIGSGSVINSWLMDLFLLYRCFVMCIRHSRSSSFTFVWFLQILIRIHSFVIWGGVWGIAVLFDCAFWLLGLAFFDRRSFGHYFTIVYRSFNSSVTFCFKININ